MIEGDGAAAFQAIDREIEGGFRSLTFAPELERTYEDDRRTARERYFILTGQIATAFYDIFLVSDWQMMPDVFKLAAFVRLGLLTPVFLIAWFLVSRHPRAWFRETIATAMPVLAVALIMFVLTTSRSPDMASYQYGTVLIMVFTAVVQRPRIRFAAAGIVCIIAIQLIAVANLHDVRPQQFASSVTFFLTSGFILLWATYVLEHENRRAYLLGKRSHLLNDHLTQIAKRDPLTGLWNRRHLDTVMATAWTDAATRPRPMSVILFDIDYFKTFNDTYGHIAGDKCLQRVAASVRDAIQSDDRVVVVRFGGEEFLVFMDGGDAKAAEAMAARIQALIKTASIPHPTQADGVVVSASFGVATGHAPLPAAEALIAAADEALYSAKRSGRDCIWAAAALTGRPLSGRGFDLPVAC